MLTLPITDLTPRARRHLYVTDLDGTLLGDDARVSDRSAQIISELSHMGAMITVATARTAATVDRLLQHTFTRLPAIVMTGAALWDRAYRRYSEACPITDEAAAAAIAAIRGAGMAPFIYTLGGDGLLHVYRNGPMSPKEQRFVTDRSRLPLKRFHIDSPEGLAPAFPFTMLLLVMGPIEEVYRLADTLRRMPDITVSAYPDNYNAQSAVLEVLGRGVSKAATMLRLAKQIGAERITVYGDNLNDLPMMRAADEAVAVANAQSSVIDEASCVIEPNSTDSVARHILRSVLADCGA